MIEELADGAVVIEVPYGSTDWLLREILKGAGELVVLEPEAAREAIARELAGGRRRHRRQGRLGAKRLGRDRRMCFDYDSRPPELPAELIGPPIAGGAAAELLTLESADGPPSRRRSPRRPREASPGW